VDQLGGEVLGQVGRRHHEEIPVLDHEAAGFVPPRIRTVGHHQLQLRKVQADLVQVHRVLALTRRRWAGNAGVDRDGKAQVDALRVDREVDGVVGWEVDHERRDPHQHQVGLLPLEALDGAKRLHPPARIDLGPQEEAVRARLDEAEHVVLGTGGVGGQDRLLHAQLVHGLDDLLHRVVAEEVLALLEVVLGHVLQELGATQVAHLDVHPAIDRARRHALPIPARGRAIPAPPGRRPPRAEDGPGGSHPEI
jgi:hypothetical protein